MRTTKWDLAGPQTGIQSGPKDKVFSFRFGGFQILASNPRVFAKVGDGGARLSYVTCGRTNTNRDRPSVQLVKIQQFSGCSVALRRRSAALRIPSTQAGSEALNHPRATDPRTAHPRAVRPRPGPQTVARAWRGFCLSPQELMAGAGLALSPLFSPIPTLVTEGGG